MVQSGLSVARIVDADSGGLAKRPKNTPATKCLNHNLAIGMAHGSKKSVELAPDFDQLLKRATGKQFLQGRACQKTSCWLTTNHVVGSPSRDFCVRKGYHVDEADGVSELQLLDNKNFDLLICDLLMPRISGFDVIAQMKSRSLSMPVILVTGYPDAVVEKGLGDVPRFTKPFNLYDLLHKVKDLLTE